MPDCLALRILGLWLEGSLCASYGRRVRGDPLLAISRSVSRIPSPLGLFPPALGISASLGRMSSGRIRLPTVSGQRRLTGQFVGTRHALPRIEGRPSTRVSHPPRPGAVPAGAAGLGSGGRDDPAGRQDRQGGRRSGSDAPAAYSGDSRELVEAARGASIADEVIEWAVTCPATARSSSPTFS